MGGDNRKIRDAIQKIAKQKREDYLISIPATVTDVSGHLCDVEPNNGDAEIFDVRLQPSNVKGIYIEPVVGSTVYITQLDENNYFVVMYSEVVQIQIGGDDYGGLTITPELRNQLEKNNNLLQQLINILNGPPIPEPGNGAASALQAALSASITGLSLGTFDSIENENITHGKIG